MPKQATVHVCDISDYLMDPDMMTSAQIEYATASRDLMLALADLVDAVNEVEPDGLYHGCGGDEEVDRQLARFQARLNVARGRGRRVMDENFAS